MELKEFVKKVIIDLDLAVKEAGQETEYSVSFSDKKEKRTIEFDIAVTTEDIDTKSGKTGIRVLQFAEAGGKISKENKNSTVSRISFGVHVDTITKQERQVINNQFREKKQISYR
jgi:hypothetical protein